jgi:transposase-like protein
MPWMERSAVSLRRELVELAKQPGARISRLAQRFSASRKPAHKWLGRDRTDRARGQREAWERFERACADQRRETVQEALMALFRRHGLPWAILCDKGPPGAPNRPGATRA